MIRSGDRHSAGHIDAMWPLNGAKCCYSLCCREDMTWRNPFKLRWFCSPVAFTIICICCACTHVPSVKDYVRFSTCLYVTSRTQGLRVHYSTSSHISHLLTVNAADVDRNHQMGHLSSFPVFSPVWIWYYTFFFTASPLFPPKLHCCLKQKLVWAGVNGNPPSWANTVLLKHLGGKVPVVRSAPEVQRASAVLKCFGVDGWHSVL